MSRAYVIPLPTKRWLSAGLLLLLLFGIARASRAQEGKWYFLTGTSTEDTDRHYPSVLYTIVNTKKLRIIRQVASGDDGVHSIQQYDSAIFVNYPHLPPTTVGVVHADNPGLADAVIFNPEGQVVIDSKLATCAPAEHGVNEIVWLRSVSENRAGGTVTSIVGTSSTKKPRIERDAWDQYAFLRFGGIPGGPVVAPDLVGSFREGGVGIEVSNRYVTVARLSPDTTKKVQGRVPYFIGASERFLVFALQDRAEDVQSGALAKITSVPIFVQDRSNGGWTTGPLEGSCSRTRMFGSWLATIVQFWEPDHSQNPGANHERNTETDVLPNTRELYSMSAGRDCRIPGVLILQNLETGKKVTITTGEEDSEILTIHEGTVLYRINDKIYEATIDGQSLRDTKLIVEDEDVPEIHWAFWSE